MSTSDEAMAAKLKEHREEGVRHLRHRAIVHVGRNQAKTLARDEALDGLAAQVPLHPSDFTLAAEYLRLRARVRSLAGGPAALAAFDERCAAAGATTAVQVASLRGTVASMDCGAPGNRAQRRNRRARA